MKLYHYTCHDINYEDTGHVIAESKERAEEIVQEIFENGEHLASFVEEVEIEGYEIKVNRVER